MLVRGNRNCQPHHGNGLRAVSGSGVAVQVGNKVVYPLVFSEPQIKPLKDLTCEGLGSLARQERVPISGLFEFVNKIQPKPKSAHQYGRIAKGYGLEDPNDLLYLFISAGLKIDYTQTLTEFAHGAYMPTTGKISQELVSAALNKIDKFNKFITEGLFVKKIAAMNALMDQEFITDIGVISIGENEFKCCSLVKGKTFKDTIYYLVEKLRWTEKEAEEFLILKLGISRV